MRLAEGAEQVLHVVADFVRDDVGEGKFAARTHFLHFAVEGGIDVEFLVGGAVEGAGGAAADAAGGLHLSLEEDEGRLAVGFAVLAEDGLPDVFGGSEDGAEEAFGFVVFAAAGAALALADATAFDEAKHGAGIDAECPADEDDEESAEADAAADECASAASVFDVAAATIVLPFHIVCLCCVG